LCTGESFCNFSFNWTSILYVGSFYNPLILLSKLVLIIDLFSSNITFYCSILYPNGVFNSCSNSLEIASSISGSEISSPEET